MSKNARFVPMTYPEDRSVLANLDWTEWETKSGAKFPEESRRKVEGATVAFHSMERAIDSGLMIKFEVMRRTLRTLKYWLAEHGEQIFFAEHLPSLHSKSDLDSESYDLVVAALAYVDAHVARKAPGSLDLVPRMAEMLRLMRDCPGDVSIELSRAEAFAVYEIQQVFLQLSLPAKVTHSRPTKANEGSEPLSVFEEFCFVHVLSEFCGDPSGKKVLYRRLAEAESALGKAEKAKLKAPRAMPTAVFPKSVNTC